MNQNISSIILNSDLGNNGILLLERLKHLKDSNFVDLGVRYGVSSAIMLHDSISNNNKVYGVDIVNTVNAEVLNHPNYIFLHTDSITAAKRWDKGPVNVLFVDTLHIKEQVLKELYFWMPHLADDALIVFHDTHWPEGKYDFFNNKFWDRPEEAVKLYFNIDILNIETNELKVDHFETSWGMTFVQLNQKLKCYGENVDWNSVLLFNE